MKHGKIVEYALTATVTGALAVGVIYTVAGAIYTGIANHQNRFQGIAEVNGRRIFYHGTWPYKPIIRFAGQDRNGNATIEFADDDSIVVKANNLNEPVLSLDDRVTLKLPGGQKIEFDSGGVYKDGDRHPFQEDSEVARFLRGIFLVAKEMYEQAEASFQKDAAKK